MKNKTLLITSLVFLAIGTGGYYFFELNNKSDDHAEEHNHVMTQNNEGDTPMPAGHINHAGMVVKSEREFLEGMIPHHQEAVDTAKEVTERGGSNERIKTLVEGIIFAQEKEIAEMKRWYLDWYGEDYKDKGVYQPMMGELGNLSGGELDKRFLEDMIMHHMGAIMMVQSVKPHINHQEVSDLTKAIVTSQTEEIKIMGDLLEGLK